MSQATMHGVDLFAKHTDVNGKTSYQSHRVWDKETFVSTRSSDAAKENAKQKEGESRLAKFEQITQEQYVAGRRA